MSSILKNTLRAMLLAAICGGCQVISPVGPVVEAPPPPPTDEAMARRDWAPSNLAYESRTAIAGPTRTRYEARDDIPEPARLALEPAQFIGNIAISPLTVLFDPPFVSPHGYRPETVPPSFSGVPVPPPETPDRVRPMPARTVEPATTDTAPTSDTVPGTEMIPATDAATVVPPTPSGDLPAVATPPAVNAGPATRPASP